jgi:hypothetical protein
MSVVYGGRNDPPERRLKDASAKLSKGKKAIADNVTKAKKKLSELEATRISADAAVDRIFERVATATSDKAVGETTGKMDNRLTMELNRNVSSITESRMVAEKEEKELTEAIAKAKAEGELLAQMASEFEKDTPMQKLETVEAVADKAEESSKAAQKSVERIDALSSSATTDANGIQFQLRETNGKADFIRKKVEAVIKSVPEPQRASFTRQLQEQAAKATADAAAQRAKKDLEALEAAKKQEEAAAAQVAQEAAQAEAAAKAAQGVAAQVSRSKGNVKRQRGTVKNAQLDATAKTAVANTKASVEDDLVARMNQLEAGANSNEQGIRQFLEQIKQLAAKASEERAKAQREAAAAKQALQAAQAELSGIREIHTTMEKQLQDMQREQASAASKAEAATKTLGTARRTSALLEEVYRQSKEMADQADALYQGIKQETAAAAAAVEETQRYAAQAHEARLQAEAEIKALRDARKSLV